MQKKLISSIIGTEIGVLFTVIIPVIITYKIIDIDKIHSYMNSITASETIRILISFSIGFIIYIVTG